MMGFFAQDVFEGGESAIQVSRPRQIPCLLNRRRPGGGTWSRRCGSAYPRGRGWMTRIGGGFSLWLGGGWSFWKINAAPGTHLLSDIHLGTAVGTSRFFAHFELDFLMTVWGKCHSYSVFVSFFALLVFTSEVRIGVPWEIAFNAVA